MASPVTVSTRQLVLETGDFRPPISCSGRHFGVPKRAAGAARTHTPLIADVTGDGFADIVGFAQGGVYVSLNTHVGVTAPKFAAGTSFWGTQTGGWSSEDAYPRKLADVNGDGMADLVARPERCLRVPGHWSWELCRPALVPGSSFWGTQTGGWSSQDAYPRELANINFGDIPAEKADIVGFASNGVWTSISTSTAFISTSDTSPSPVSMLDLGSPSGVPVSSPDVALLWPIHGGELCYVERRERRHVGHGHAADHTAGFVDAASPMMLASRKTPLSIFAKTSYEEDGCAGQKLRRARI